MTISGCALQTGPSVACFFTNLQRTVQVIFRELDKKLTGIDILILAKEFEAIEKEYKARQGNVYEVGTQYDVHDFAVSMYTMAVQLSAAPSVPGADNHDAAPSTLEQLFTGTRTVTTTLQDNSIGYEGHSIFETFCGPADILVSHIHHLHNDCPVFLPPKISICGYLYYRLQNNWDWPNGFQRIFVPVCC
jgi:hypothetical protein